LPVAPQAETTIKRPFKDGKPSVRLKPQQKQFAGLISRKGQTQTLFLHPIAELPRGGQFQSF
jgi:hypothetical protein